MPRLWIYVIGINRISWEKKEHTKIGFAHARETTMVFKADKRTFLMQTKVGFQFHGGIT